MNVVQVLTGDFDFDEIAGLVRLDIGREHERTAHLVGRVAYTTVEFHGHGGDVVGIDQTVAR